MNLLVPDPVLVGLVVALIEIVKKWIPQEEVLRLVGVGLGITFAVLNGQTWMVGLVSGLVAVGSFAVVKELLKDIGKNGNERLKIH